MIIDDNGMCTLTYEDMVHHSDNSYRLICPYCKGPGALKEYDDYDRFYYYIQCRDCGAHKPLFYTPDNDLACWRALA